MKLNETLLVDCLDGLASLPEKCVDTCVTSPPYYALRDYGIEKTVWPEIRYRLFGFEIVVPQQCCCLGLEDSPEYFIGHMVHVFRQVHRVLKDEGTCWINIGDSYWAGKGKSGQSYSSEYQNERYNAGRSFNGAQHQIGGKNQTRPTDGKHPELKPKDKIGIPWMLAFALRGDGWYLRQDIIWSKTNPMPESVADRCTTSHEYIFLLSKSEKYYFDAYAIATDYAEKTYTTFGIENKPGIGDGSGLIKGENWSNSVSERKPKVWKTPDGWDTAKGSHGSIHRKGREKGRKPRSEVDNRGGNQGTGDIPPISEKVGRANKRSVWTISTRAFKEAHFATFPERLICDCIKAGCPEEGIVLDPFHGASTTGLVARKLNRNFIAFEKKPEYKTMGDNRLSESLGLFK